MDDAATETLSATPLRLQAFQFQKSRDRWKAKALGYRQQGRLGAQSP